MIAPKDNIHKRSIIWMKWSFIRIIVGFPLPLSTMVIWRYRIIPPRTNIDVR